MSGHGNRPDPRRGVFETLLVRNGRPVELTAHLQRLRSSLAAVFGAPLPDDAEPLVLDRARDITLGRLRLTVAPDGSGALAADVRVAPVEASLVFPAFERAPRLEPLTVPGGLGAHKWADRSLVEPAELDGFLPLLMEEDGEVLEASRANVFIVEEGTLVTPPSDGRILPGVTRRRVLELMPVREEAVPLHRLLAADEVFVTGSVRGIEPVRDCDGRRRWAAGPLTRAVSDRLRRRWEGSP